MQLKKLISNKSHWTVNKHLAREIGLETTLILQHLIDWSDYHKKETIFQTYEQIENELGLSNHAVKRVGIPELKKRGFISVERKGVGYKNYYRVNNKAIFDFLTQPTSELNMTPLEEDSVNSPTSEVESTSLKGENDPTRQDENIGAINKNILSQESIEQESIYKESTATGAVAGNLKNIVTKSIIDVLLDFDINVKDYNKAVEEFKELGEIDGIAAIMEWDDSVKERHHQAIKNVNKVRTHEQRQ